MKIKKWCIIAIFRQKHVKLNFDKTFGAVIGKPMRHAQFVHIR
jgi:hypothetical protein